MENEKKLRPIRLTNRTAIGLRKTAKRVHGAWLIAMGFFAMIATVTAVSLGFFWLPAVPLTLLSAGVIILLMLLISRSQYLLLTSQAICTEAASRTMEDRAREHNRRRQAIEQLAVIRADVQAAQKNGVSTMGGRSEESILFDLLTGCDPSDEEILCNRRRQEDDEMFGEDYCEETDVQDDVDLRPAKPVKKPQTAAAAPQTTLTVKPAVKAENAAPAQEGQRRRRRSAPVQTAPLTLIRSDKAQ